MSPGIELNQVILLFVLTAAIVLLLAQWIRLDLTAILKVPGWKKLIIPQIGFDPARAPFWYFVRSASR